jgi:exo-beta-1,3-glucanase (GH17 family)
MAVNNEMGSIQDIKGISKIIKENSPNYWWVNHNVRIHKSHFRKNKIKKLYEDGIFKYYDENKSEFENMKNNGYIRLYDCGTIKVVYDKN